MRGLRATGDGVRVVPTEPSGEGVRVRVARSGICGSDLHLASFGPSAVTLGHEFCGHLDDGTAVAVRPVVACGRCPRCREGQDQQCSTALGTLYGVTRDGGLADEAWVDPSCATPLPDGLRLDHAVLVEPVAVALHGLHRAGVEDGMRVLVLGAGPIGLCAVAVAGLLGTAVDLEARRSRRLAAGERLGARVATAPEYDVVVDAAGTQGSLDRAVALVRPGGTVAVLGTYWSPVALGLGFQMKEVTLLPAFVYGHHHGVGEFEEAARLLARLPDLAEVLVTHEFALDDAVEAFRVAGDRHEDAIKVVLRP